MQMPLWMPMTAAVALRQSPQGPESPQGGHKPEKELLRTPRPRHWKKRHEESTSRVSETRRQSLRSPRSP